MSLLERRPIGLVCGSKRGAVVGHGDEACGRGLAVDGDVEDGFEDLVGETLEEVEGVAATPDGGEVGAEEGGEGGVECVEEAAICTRVASAVGCVLDGMRRSLNITHLWTRVDCDDLSAEFVSGICILFEKSEVYFTLT
jgi:hypothetical protein